MWPLLILAGIGVAVWSATRATAVPPNWISSNSIGWAYNSNGTPVGVSYYYPNGAQWNQPTGGQGWWHTYLHYP